MIVQRRSKSPPPCPVRDEGKVNPDRMQVRLCGHGAFSSLFRGRIKERIRQMIILKQNPAYYRLSFYAPTAAVNTGNLRFKSKDTAHTKGVGIGIVLIGRSSVKCTAIQIATVIVSTTLKLA